MQLTDFFKKKRKKKLPWWCKVFHLKLFQNWQTLGSTFGKEKVLKFSELYSCFSACWQPCRQRIFFLSTEKWQQLLMWREHIILVKSRDMFHPHKKTYLSRIGKYTWIRCFLLLLYDLNITLVDISIIIDQNVSFTCSLFWLECVSSTKCIYSTQSIPFCDTQDWN